VAGEKEWVMETKPVVYLSGKITGNDGYKEFFAFWENIFEQGGYAVMNPAKLDVPGEELPWIQCIIRDLGYLLLCDYVALLPGWEESAGARIEMMAAVRLGKPLIIPPGSTCQATFSFEAKPQSEMPEPTELGNDVIGLDGEIDLSDIPGWDNEIPNEEEWVSGDYPLPWLSGS